MGIMQRRILLVGLVAVFIAQITVSAETLPPLADGAVPQTVDELWAGYDPQAEPLD